MYACTRVIRFHVSDARRARGVFEYKQRKTQIQEQGPAAGYTVRNVKKMQQNDKKVKEKLNAHICLRLHSPQRLLSKCVRLDRDLFLAPACFNSGSSCGHQYIHPDTVKQIQRSEPCFFIIIVNHAFVLVVYKNINFYKKTNNPKPQLTSSRSSREL